MKLYAGIHISDGKAVNPDDLCHMEQHVPTPDPVKLALHWQEMGATCLHVIDLDAAAMGYPVNEPTIKAIVDAVEIPVQYGGGLRTIKDIDTYLNMGVSRVIVSTEAIQNPHFLQEALHLFGADKILVGIDADKGMAIIEGRAKIGSYNSLTMAQQMEELGVKTVFYTDINAASDRQGPDVENTRELINRTHLKVIYAGGIASLQDLRYMQETGVNGVMVGAALYTNRIKLGEAVKLYERGE
jgi:phosphoribosylformimino-5-aminoimidazole carboxamide ribotide isomerase